jgi:hypothetical protein
LSASTSPQGGGEHSIRVTIVVECVEFGVASEGSLKKPLILVSRQLNRAELFEMVIDELSIEQLKSA